MVLVHHYTGNCGIGDLLRSMIVYYAYCTINEIEYYLDFSETHLKYCFDNKIKEIKNEEIENILIDFNYGPNTKTFLNEIRKNKDKIYFVVSNVYQFIDLPLLNKYKKGFSEFLVFSDTVKNRASTLLEMSGIINDYMCIHVRCGDQYYLKNNKHNINNLTSPDNRISPEQALLDIEYIIENFIKKENINKENALKNIIVVCDNNILKQKLKTIYSCVSSVGIGDDDVKVTVLNTNIYHIALVPEKQDSEYLDNYIDSIVEFYILTKSKKNICLAVSGFSYMSSYIYDVPLYKLNEYKVLEKVESI